MRQLALPQFESERSRFSLRFTCEHCTYFNPVNERCTHGYPNAEHREQRYHVEAARSLATPDQPGAGALVFCKEFELR